MRPLTVCFGAVVAVATAQKPYEDNFLKAVSPTDIGEWLDNITATPHLAGTPEGEATALWYKQELETLLAPIATATVELDTHENILLSYYESAELTVGNETLTLREEPIAQDPTSDSEWNERIWNGYGATGNITDAEIVYVNYGTPEDYVRLDDMNPPVSVRNRIVLARYGQCFRGVKAHQAELRGAAGLLIYSDPQEYGGPRYPSDVYPTGPYLPESGVQRGSVLNMPRCPGNPRGRADVCGYEEDELLPKIPVMPLSAANARRILEQLKGSQVPVPWRGGLPGLTYRVGPGPNVSLSVVNVRDERAIHNVIATIPGTLDDPRIDTPILLGNHRDAWVYGAADPSSGSAAMLAVAKGFAAAWEKGWRPNRTIIMGSWDAEEYGIIGSTAYAEKNRAALFNAAVYINVDTAVSGDSKFGASASPAVIDALVRAAAIVGETVVPETVGPMGGGSDYAPFLNHLGIASVDFGYQFNGAYPVYHSVYDSFHWMEKYGDPDKFEKHAVVAKIWGLLAIQFASDIGLPLNVSVLGERLIQYGNEAETALQQSTVSGDLTELKAAIVAYKEEADVFMSLLTGSVMNNTMLAQAERTFLHEDGLPKRRWYKSLIMASGFDLGYGAQTFPGLHQAIADNDDGVFAHQLDALTTAIRDGTEELRAGRPRTAPSTDDGDEGPPGPGVVVALCVGIPVFIVGTVLLVQRLSGPRRPDTSVGATTYGTRPVSMETDDGTTTEV